jgi:hypothetical protein
MARLYTITGQRQVQALDPGRQLVDMYEVSYDGPNNISGSVRIPVRGATAEAVDQLIRQQLQTQLGFTQLGDDES